MTSNHFIDVNGADWLAIRELVGAELERARTKLETTGLAPAVTDEYRGRILQLKWLLALPASQLEDRAAKLIAPVDYD